MNKEKNPLTGIFLNFIEKDIIENPQNLSLVNKKDYDETKSLVEGIEIADETEMPEDFEL